MHKLAMVYIGHGFQENLAVEATHIIESSTIVDMRTELIQQLSDRGDADLLTESLLCFSGVGAPASLDSVFTCTDKTAVMLLEMGYVMLLDITDMPMTGDVVYELELQETCGVTKVGCGEDYDIPDEWTSGVSHIWVDDDTEACCLALNLLLC